MNELPLALEERVSKTEVIPTRVRWRIVGLLMAYVAFCHFNRISMSVAGTEQIMPRYGIDETVMGSIYSAYLLLYTLCMTPGGWFIDRFGVRAALMVVGFGSAILVALTGVAGILLLTGPALVTGLLVVRAALGVVSAPIHPSGARAVGSWIPAALHSTANGVVVGAACLGIASTYLIFGQLSDWFGWPGAFLTAGLATALLAIVWAGFATDTPTGHPAVNEAERKLIGEQPADSGTGAPAAQQVADPPLFRNRSLLLLMLSYAAVNYFQYLFFYWMQYYFDTVLGLGRSAGRIVSSVLILAMGAGMFAGGWLADRAQARFGPRRGRALVPVAGMVLSAVGLGLGLLSTETTLTVACFAIALAAIGATEGPFWTSAVELGGRRGGTAAGILNTGGNAGGLLAPVITPLFSHYFGWQVGLGLAGLVCLLGAALWIGIDPTRSPEPSSTDSLAQE